jgi:LmbE family N-acetylglucosaminyl deacetylase
MIFSPHPDDECIIGGLALRLRREQHMNVFNVAVTLGSDPDRQAERWTELTHACAFLGFGLLATCPRGLTGINPATRANQPAAWAASVQIIANLLAEHQPTLLFTPHAADWNRTHLGTHHLVLDALPRLDGYRPVVIETEFWGAMPNPNLLVEITPHDLADLVAALSFHAGEVQRNPYHLRLPAWMQDNVRRGGEVVGGQGTRAPAMSFATLYRASRWTGDRLTPLYATGTILPATSLLPVATEWLQLP